MSITGTHPLGKDTAACTGCAACAAVCPEYCITMRSDAEGFLYPHVNKTVCKDCGLCHETCPINSVQPASKDSTIDAKQNGPLQVFAAWHLDEAIRRESSSGGVFTALAENILAQGGVVFGAAFDEQLVVRHTLITKPADLHLLRGSKYVQSEVSPSIYHQIRDLLGQNRPVLFSGAPCQVAGLQNFLGKPSAILNCCDLVCHGVPSPKLLASYVQHNYDKGHHLARVSFRDKTTGWKKFSIRQHLQDSGSRLFAMFADPYMVAFLRNYALRPACYVCRFTNTVRPGDLTIGDFWGVGKKYPQYDQDDKGTSLVLVNTKKGHVWINACRESLFLGPADLKSAIEGNPVLVQSCYRPSERETFYQDLNTISFDVLIRKYSLYPPSLPRRVLSGIKRRFMAICTRMVKTLKFMNRRLK